MRIKEVDAVEADDRKAATSPRSAPACVVDMPPRAMDMRESDVSWRIEDPNGGRWKVAVELKAVRDLDVANHTEDAIEGLVRFINQLVHGEQP